MAQPSAPYTAAALQRATDTNFSTGDEAGLSTKLEPSAPQKAQGHVSGLAAPAGWQNYWEHGVGLWLSYLAGLDTDAYFLGQTYDWTDLHTFLSGLVANGVNLQNNANVVFEGVGEVNYTTARSYTLRRGMTGHGSHGADTYTDTNHFGGVIITQEPGATTGFIYHQPIELPSGAEITAWRALVTPLTGGGLTVRLFRVAHTFGGSPAIDAAGTGVGAGDTSSGGSLQTLEITGLSETVDNETNQYVLVFIDSTTPSVSPISMEIHGYEIDYEMPGLRNG